MAGEENVKVEQEPGEPAVEDKELETGADGQPKPIPYQRFKQVREEAKALAQQVAEQAAALKELQAAEAKRAEEAKAAEEQDLAKKQEFEQLATKRAAERDEAKAAAAQLETDLAKYKDTVNVYLEAARKNIPEHLITLLNKLEPLEQLSYITENQQQLGVTLVEGVPASPSTKTPINNQPKDEERRKAAAVTARF